MDIRILRSVSYKGILNHGSQGEGVLTLSPFKSFVGILLYFITALPTFVLLVLKRAWT